MKKKIKKRDSNKKNTVIYILLEKKVKRMMNNINLKMEIVF
jgi:hypothetical protein